MSLVMSRPSRETLRTDRDNGWHIRINDARIVLATWPAQGDSPDPAELGAGEQCEGCGNDMSEIKWDATYFICRCGARYRMRAGGFRDKCPPMAIFDDDTDSPGPLPPLAASPKPASTSTVVTAHDRPDGRTAFYMRDRVDPAKYTR